MESKALKKTESLLIFRNNRFFEINNAGVEYSFSDLLRETLDIAVDEETTEKDRASFNDFNELFDFVSASQKSKTLLSALDFSMSYDEEMIKRDYRKRITQILHHTGEEKKLTQFSNNPPGNQKYFKSNNVSLFI